MLLTTTSLVLIGATLHATWNLLVRSRETSLDTMWSGLLIPSLLGITVLCVDYTHGTISLTSSGVWWAFLSSLIHVIYFGVVTYAYRHGEASIIYPITRGVGLILATFAGALIFVEEIRSMRIVGITTVTLALISLALRNLRRESSLRDILAASTLGVCVGIASVTDTFGVRELGGFPYATLLFFFTELLLVPLMVVRCGGLKPCLDKLQPIRDLPFGLLYFLLLFLYSCGSSNGRAPLRCRFARNKCDYCSSCWPTRAERILGLAEVDIDSGDALRSDIYSHWLKLC